MDSQTAVRLAARFAELAAAFARLGAAIAAARDRLAPLAADLDATFDRYWRTILARYDPVLYVAVCRARRAREHRDRRRT